MKSDRSLNDDLKALISRYEKQLIKVNSQIDALYLQQQEITEAMNAISVLLKEPVKNTTKDKHQKVRGVKRKAKYHHISCKGFAIAMLTDHPEGLTVMEMAEEMALPSKEAIKTCYGSIVCALRTHQYGENPFQQKGDKWVLKKVEVIQPEPVKDVISMPIPQTTSTPAPKASQPDIFADLGDFLKKQEQKHYPSKAIANQERVG